MRAPVSRLSRGATRLAGLLFVLLLGTDDRFLGRNFVSALASLAGSGYQDRAS